MYVNIIITSKKDWCAASSSKTEKEITTWICREGEVVTSIVSILDIEAVGENIKTLENSELIEMPTSGIQYLYDHYPDFNTVGRKLLERYYYDAQQRAIICRIPNASKRYEHFINTRPELGEPRSGKIHCQFPEHDRRNPQPRQERPHKEPPETSERNPGISLIHFSTIRLRRSAPEQITWPVSFLIDG